MRFNINTYSEDRIVMHCSTEDEAMQFLSYLESEGYLWFSGDEPTKPQKLVKSLVSREEETVFVVHRAKLEIHWGFYDSYSRVSILEFSDFDWGEEVDCELEPNEELLSYLLKMANF